MNLRIHSSQLQQILDVAGAATTHDSLLILSYVLLTADEEKQTVEVRGTNIDCDFKAKSTAEVLEGGKICIPYNKTAEICLRYKGILCIQTSDSQITITIADKFRTEFRFDYLSAEEFPPEINMDAPSKSWELQSSIVRQMAAHGLTIVSKDETRMAINQLYIDSGNFGVRLVSTDGRQLGMFELSDKPWPVFGSPIRSEVLECLVNRTPTVGEYLTVACAGGDLILPERVCITGHWFKLAAKLMPLNYPKYMQVVPIGDIKAELQISAPEMLQAVKLMNSMEVEDNWIRLIYTGGELVLKKNKDAAIVSVIKPKHLLTNGLAPNIEIAFNPLYLERTLAMFGETMTFQYFGSVEPAVFYEARIKTVLMPMRIAR